MASPQGAELEAERKLLSPAKRKQAVQHAQQKLRVRQRRACRVIVVNHIVKRVADQAGIKKNIHPHLFRHWLCTTLLEQGVNVRIVSEKDPIAFHKKDAHFYFVQ